jgi:hypothetical protein
MRRPIVAQVSLVMLASSVLVGAPAGAQPIVGRTCAGSWTVAPQPAPGGSGGLEGVAATSPADAWAVGHLFVGSDQTGHTLIEHHDATSWSIVASPDGPNAAQSSLEGVDTRTLSDAWAVGTYVRPNNLIRTLIEHWDGSTWHRMKSPNAGTPAGGSLSGVAALAADDAWAVGSFGQGAPGRTLTEHWDGTSWSVVPSPNKGPFPNALSSVTAVGPDDVWAVGTWFTKAFVDRTLVLHWNGTSWHHVKSPNVGPAENDLTSVAAVATDDIWAVGLHGLHTLTEHWDGTSWSVVSSPTPGGIADLAGVAAVATDDVWAVGGRVDKQANAVRTLVEHWNGTAWAVVPSENKGPSDNHLWGVASAPGRLSAVGDRFTGGGTGPLVPLTLERCGP